MTGAHLVMAWLDTALLSSMVVLGLGNRFRLGSISLRIGVVLVALCSLVPVHGFLLFMYVHSMLGDLSLTSKAFLIAWLLYRLGGPVLSDMKEIRFVMRAIAITGLVFYPLALGLSPFDPYSVGYSASVLIVITIIAGVYGLREGYMVLASAMLLGLWGYLLGFMESDNLFDYLLDPMLFLYAAGFTCVTLLRNLKAMNTAGRKA